MNILLMFAEFGLSEEERDRQCFNTRPFSWKTSVDYPNCYLGGRVLKKEKEQLKFQALKGHAAGEADPYMVTVNTKERIHHHLCLLRNPPRMAQVSFLTWVRVWPAARKSAGFLPEIQSRTTVSQHVCPRRQGTEWTGHKTAILNTGLFSWKVNALF